MNEEIEELGRDESEPLLGKLSKFANSDNPECSGAVSISDLRDLSGLLLEDDGVGWDVEELEGKFREWGEYFGPFLQVDPFTNRTPEFSWYQLFKFIILIPFSIIRIFVFFFALFLCWVVSAIAVRGLTFPRNPEEVPPLPQERRQWAEKIASFNRAMMWACGFFHFERTGERDRSAGMLVANHVSFFDPFIINSDLAVAPLNKMELANLPLAGTILRGIQAILVDRSSKESRKSTANIMKKRAVDNQQSPDTWPPTLVFPEGTCTNGDVVMAFRPGAFLAGEPVQPVILKYPWKFWDISFTPAISLPRVVSHGMFQFYNRIEMKYLPLYYPSDEEQQDPGLYAKNVQRLIANELGVPATSHSYYDMHLVEHAWCKKGFPLGSMRFEIDLLKERMPKLTTEFTDKCFEEFCVIDKNRNGKISFVELLDYFCFPTPPPTPFLDLFSLACFLSSDGKFEFVEYVVLMYGLMHLGSQEKDKKLFLEMRGKQEGEEGEEEVLEEKEFLALMGAHEEWSQTKTRTLFESMSKSHVILSFAHFQEFLDNNLLHRFLFRCYVDRK